jgi:cyclic pyranopterin phosphate synthase
MSELIDKFGRKINYLRISVTDRCNLRCEYCMPPEGIELKSHSDILSYEEIISICKKAVKIGIDKIRLTGGEPLVRKGIVGLVRGIAEIPGIRDLAMTTNGITLDKFALPLKEAGLLRVNVSLDSLKKDRYKRITRGGDVENVLRGIDAALRAGLKPVKVNVVLMNGINDDEIPDLYRFADERGVLIQFIHPMTLKSPRTPQMPQIYNRPPNCANCNRLRLTADGKIKPCLLSDREIDVRTVDIYEAIFSAIDGKPKEGMTCHARKMVEIGG